MLFIASLVAWWPAFKPKKSIDFFLFPEDEDAAFTWLARIPAVVCAFVVVT
jgi:hypothetical protein